MGTHVAHAAADRSPSSAHAAPSARAGPRAYPVVSNILRAPVLQRQSDGEDSELDHINSLGGACFKSVFGGEVMFVGLSEADLENLAVINEDTDTGLTRPVLNNVWHDCDGFWQRGHDQWFKIPDHCAVEVTSLEPLEYEQCCNAAASLLKDGPHWSDDGLDESKSNPFT